MESNLIEFLKRAAEKSGFNRLSYVERNIPTVSDNIVVIPFFGDIRSTFTLSSLLLKPYCEYTRKYIVLCTWPGLQSLFPYVDEYWAIRDKSSMQTLASAANNFYNPASLVTDYTRLLNQQFENVLTHEEWKPYYSNGITPKYWEAFDHVNRFLPEVPSLTKMSDVFKNDLGRRPGAKVVVYPAKQLRSWRLGKVVNVTVPQSFWKQLLNRLIAENITPVVYQNYSTYDMSQDFTDKCVWLVPQDVSQVFCAMRATDCVLDLFTGISRWAIAARTPYVCLDERNRYIEHKEYEVDDLCCEGLPKQYVFSFSSLITEGSPSEWDSSVLDGVVVALKKFLPGLDKNNLPSTVESYGPVSYDCVRERKAQRMGIRFIKRY